MQLRRLLRKFSTITGNDEPMEFCRNLPGHLFARPEFWHGSCPDGKWDIEHTVEH